MKTAQEWQDELCGETSLESIRAIQDDARQSDEPTLEQVMIRGLAITIVQDVAKLKGYEMPTDYETLHTLAESVIEKAREQATKIIAANTERHAPSGAR